ncbi:MAG: CHAT domain-containing protein [Chloroflexi bacterium]|nr:CHAT domain-containing protein [Chloroflexota bacterium]
MTFRDFVLLATDVQEIKEAGQKRITFNLRVPPTDFGETIAAIPTEYDAREMRQRLRELESRALDWAGVIRLGAWLGEILFPPPVRELLLQALARVEAKDESLRIRLVLDGPLHNVPWEYVLLNRGGGEATQLDFLGLMPNVSIVRHQATTLPAWDVEAGMPARMVVGLASPAGYKALLLDKEQQAIEAAVSGNPRIEATFVPEATPETLLQGTEQVHIFHFAGHGDFQRGMGAQPGTTEGKGYLVLDDGYGDPQPVEADQVGLQLRKAGVRVAMLGACESGRRDDVNVWSSVAAALLKAELGAVVGMQYTVRDDCAIAFADAFYRALVAGLPIDAAVTDGRIAVTQLDARDWGVPVLYLRARDGVVFPEYAADPSLEETREDLVVRARQRIDELHGKAVAVEISTMTQGQVESWQNIETVTNGGEATGVKIGELGGGTVKAEQKVDKVDKGSSVTGVKIDRLG